MSRRAARCTQEDIRRAMKVAEEASVPMAVDILPDGTIRIRPFGPQEKTEQDVPQGADIVL